MYVIPLAAKLALALTLIAAGSAKLAGTRGFASTVRLFVPPGLGPAARTAPVTRAVAGAIAAGELAVGCASLAVPRAGWLNWVVLGLGTLFIVISVIGYARYRDRSCNCFGGLSRRKFDRRGIARSLLIGAGGVVATLPVPVSAVRLSAADAILLLAAAALAACATYAAAKAVAAVSSA
jgi:methylamine utilization protein MauE